MTHERLAIACPECSRKYAVPAGSIGAEGRTVRCVSCHHSWIALPDDVKPVAMRTVDADARTDAGGSDGAPAEPRLDGSESTSPSPQTETATIVDSTPLIDTAAVGEVVDDRTSDEDGDDTPLTEEAYDGEVAPTGRRRFKLVATLGAIVAVTAIGGVGAVLSGQIAPRETGSPVLTIRIPDRPVRQVSADGQEVITTTAEVVNGGNAPGRVPELKATMRTPDGRIVKEWRVTPPAGDIAPSGSRSVQIGTAGAQVPKGPLTLDVDMVERDRK